MHKVILKHMNLSCNKRISNYDSRAQETKILKNI